MSTLCVFNCDNDMALANFSPGFTPPARIREMMEELATLPRAWAELGIRNEELGIRAFPGEKKIEELRASQSCKLQQAERIIPNSQFLIPNLTIDEIVPWGWSPAVCHRLRQQGVPESLLPTHDQLLEIRRLSSRERAVELLAQMRQEGVCGDLHSQYCTDEAQVEAALCRWPQAILKAPWSGSGKGLRFAGQGEGGNLSGWYRRIIQQQGGVVVEPLNDKVHDLAMEFWSDGQGHVSYQGLSLFENHPNGAYRGNLLLPETEKQAWLDQFVSPAQSLAVRQWLEHRLSTLIGTAYKGYLGVDMMIVKNSQPSPINHTPYTINLHPLVELNLRMTMGMVSVLLYRRLPAGFHGSYRLEYFPTTDQLLAEEQRLQAEHSYYRRLAGGVHYLAYIVGE